VALKPTENKNLVFFFSIKEHWEEIFEAWDYRANSNLQDKILVKFFGTYDAVSLAILRRVSAEIPVRVKKSWVVSRRTSGISHLVNKYLLNNFQVLTTFYRILHPHSELQKQYLGNSQGITSVARRSLISSSIVHSSSTQTESQNSIFFWLCFYFVASLGSARDSLWMYKIMAYLV
jgi:hypothetical protein